MKYEQSPVLHFDKIVHGFFGRLDGLSTAAHARPNDLNVAYDHAATTAEVEANRSRIHHALLGTAGQPVICKQVHSATAVIVEKPFAPDAIPQADALVTATPGLILGTLTADCGPILFADPKNKIVAAAHAGWGGAYKGILAATVRMMEQLGARRDTIHACLGPCIHQKSYEVGPEFLARFIEQDEKNRDFFIPSDRDDHHRFDLGGYILRRLKAENLATVSQVNQDTCALTDLYFSHRRATLAKTPDEGRQMSAIGLLE